MNWQVILNPFSKFSEKQLLVSGLVVTLLGTILGYFFNTTFHGILDVHLIDKTSIKKIALENIVNITILCISLFVLGKYFNRKTRFIDIFNISLWYRFPLYAISLFSFLIPKDLNQRVIENSSHIENIFYNPLETILFFFYLIITIIMITYVFILLVNGFKIATNIKKWQQYAFFGVVLLFAEFFSQLILRVFLYNIN